MKKLLSLLLIAVFVFGCAGVFSSCEDTEIDGAQTGTKIEWLAKEYKLDYGREDGDFLVGDTVGVASYFDTVLCSRSISLGEGIYTFRAGLKVPDNAYTTNSPVAVLRVKNEKNGNVVASSEIYIYDFDKSDEIQNFELSFIVEKAERCEIQVVFTNRVTLYVSECSVTSVRGEDYLVNDVKTYMEKGYEKLSFDENKLYYFDVYDYVLPLRDSVLTYDISLLISCLQGLVNRDGAHLYIKAVLPNSGMTEQDDYWLSYLSEDGRFLSGKEVVKISNIFTLIDLFKGYFKGYVVWDENVPATVNVACTACGADDILPLRYKTTENSLYSLLNERYGIDCKLSLVDKFKNGESGKISDCGYQSTGSAKNDAYLWAKEKYLDCGKTNPSLMAYHLDAYGWDTGNAGVSYYETQSLFLYNKDYYIQNKAFFFDLFVFDNIAPNDDKEQAIGTDYATLEALLKKQNELADGELIEIGGFVPWYIKYTLSCPQGTFENKDGETVQLPDAVQAEWQFSRVIGKYYAVKDADAYPWTVIANASVYSLVPASGNRVQPNKAKTTEEYVKSQAEKYIIRDADGKMTGVVNKNYVMLYMGDYDSAAWMATFMKENFSDPNLGFVPMCWPMNFAPSGRMPFIYDYMYDNANENCFFVGDHNGYGYLELSSLSDGNRDKSLNGSLESFLAKTKTAWDKYDLSIQGFLINTSVDYRRDLYPYDIETMKKISAVATGGVAVNQTTINSGLNFNVITENGISVPWSSSVSITSGSVAEGSEILVNNFPQSKFPKFLQVRVVVTDSTDIKHMISEAKKKGTEIEVLNPYVYFYLLREYNAHIGAVYGG